MKSNQSLNCLFPQILDCPHRHYATVHLTALSLQLVDSVDSFLVRSSASQWTIRRSKQQLQRLDQLIHTCLVERHFSRLPSPEAPTQYAERLNELLSETLSALKCVLILNWFECDRNGLQLVTPQDSEVNQRAIGAALVVREWRFSEENSSESFLCLDFGEMVSILEVNGFWTKGKKGPKVGLFPSECVRVIDESVVRGLSCRRRRTGDSASPLVVRRVQRSQRIASLLPQFFHKMVSNEPKELKAGLKLSDILKPRVFGRDLSEQLFDSHHELPAVVSICSAFIESHGLVDGIYRLSGVSSNISRLRQQFDADLVPDLAGDPSVMADIHCVSSCLKLFFRLLPNPLLTFESYDEFVSVVRDDDDTRRLEGIRFLVRRLPPPHFRTVRALMRHLRRVSLSASTTGMTEKNLSIVWAPNLLRSRDIENRSVGGDLAALQVIGIQAVLTEYLIQRFSQIFDDETTDDSPTPQTKEKNSDLKSGSFGRQLSERNPKKISRKAVIRWKSFESFFTKKDNFFAEFRLNFAKIQTIVDLIRVLPQFEKKTFLSTAVWTTTPTPLCVPIVTTATTTTHSVVVKSECVRNDAVVVRQSVSSRERIERIKAQRRQQLRQQFDVKPVPTPRKTRLKQVAPKVDTWRPPVPTPRRRNSADADDQIRILTTAARTKRQNWNESQIQALNKR